MLPRCCAAIPCHGLDGVAAVATGLQLPKSAEAEFSSQEAANSFRGADPWNEISPKSHSIFAKRGSSRLINLEKIAVLQELKREGLSVCAVARRTGMDRKTVRKLQDRDLAAPSYAPRKPRPRRLEPYEDYLARKIGDSPDLSGRRLFREIQELGYEGGYTAVADYLHAVRPDAVPRFECSFEAEPGGAGPGMKIDGCRRCSDLWFRADSEKTSARRPRALLFRFTTLNGRARIFEMITKGGAC